jgi:hypothetical protein
MRESNAFSRITDHASQKVRGRDNCETDEVWNFPGDLLDCFREFCL